MSKVVNEFGEVCDPVAGQICHEIERRVTCYIERMLEARRVNFVEAHRLTDFFTGNIETSCLMVILQKIAAVRYGEGGE